mgnify:CR=1 FL=1
MARGPSQPQHQPATAASTQAAAAPAGEFDFESSNKLFNRDEIAAVYRQTGGASADAAGADAQPTEDENVQAIQEKAARLHLGLPPIAPKYEKSKGFFDNLSTDHSDRERDTRRPDRR